MTSSVTTPPPPPPPLPTGVPASTPPPSPPAGTGGKPPNRARELLSEAVSGTPGRMRVLGALAIVISLAFGVLGFFAVSGFHADLDDARSNAEQLVRIQTIRTSIVKADANATNAFLVGGLEPPEVRAAYTDGIATAAKTLAEASGTRTDDAAVLERVNRVLTQYTGLIEAARANNRQGFPVGAAYLRQASRVLQEDALPPLATLVRVEQQRVQSSISSGDTAVSTLFVLLALAVGALVAVQLYLSVKTRRTFNRPLVAATVLVLIAGLVGLGAVARAQSNAEDARDGPYRLTVALAGARIGGFDAKSAEALALIARGSGAAYEERFATASKSASAALSEVDLGQARAVRGALSQYVAQHGKVQGLDDGGQHDQAVSAATGAGAANQAFAEFERASSRALATQAADLADDLDDAAAPLLPVAWLVLLAGLAAAVLAWRGMSERLREYR